MSFESGAADPREARINQPQKEVNSLCRQHSEDERYPFVAESPVAAASSALTESELRISEALNREAQLRAFVMASSDVVYRMNADWTEARPLAGQHLLAGRSMPGIQ